MIIGVVGAGVSGLATARVLTAFGHDVVVWDSAEDLGGVWTGARRYPGVGLQNDKVTYGFSDFAMPAEAAEFPDGATVRAWLTAYAERYGLTRRLRLATRVVQADQGEDGRWTVELDGPDGRTSCAVDWLVMANGIFSQPSIPDWSGRAAFEAAGGRLVAPSDVGGGELLRGRDVVVVGWGKSACDLATAASRTAGSTAVVARTVRWKVPRAMGPITFGHILLTRLGEHLLWGSYRTLRGRALRVATRGVRALAVRRLEQALRRHVPLDRLGLTPRTGATDIDSLVTDGFFAAIDDGRIVVHGHTGVAALGAGDAGPTVRLEDGSLLPADVVVAATGYDQQPGPVSPAVRERLLTPSGSLRLLRSVLPEHVDRLAYIGWMHSFRSPIGAELQAIWLAGLLAGAVVPPARPWPSAQVDVFWLTRRDAARHGSTQIPRNASILDLDRLIEDFGGRIPLSTRLLELVRPLAPSAYAHLLPELARRVGATPRPVADGRAAERV